MTVKTQAKDIYEVTFIVKPTINEKNLDKLIGDIEANIKNSGGEVINIEEPFQRKITFKLKSYKEGYYVTITFKSGHELPNLLKRSLSIMEDVLRHMVIKKESKNNELK